MSIIDRRLILGLIWLATVASSTFPVASAVRADDRAFSPKTLEVMTWLPENTETVVAAQSFAMPDASTVEILGRQVGFFARLLPLYELVKLDQGKYLKPLSKARVSLALRGGRNFEIVTKFGVHRSEGCTIIVFESDLGEAGANWIRMLRDGASDVRSIAGREVFVFPSSTPVSQYAEPKPWQGTYLAILRPDTLLCATSDKYLEQILQRADTPRDVRALPDTLPEWKYIDKTASAWMIRRIPKWHDGRLIDGLAWTIVNDRVQVVYSPAANASNEVERQARTRWLPGQLDEFFGLQFQFNPDIAISQDCRVVISTRTGQLTGAGHFLFRLNLYALQAENGAVGAQ